MSGMHRTMPAGSQGRRCTATRLAAAFLLAGVAALPRAASAQPPASSPEAGTVLHLSERAERRLPRDEWRIELRIDATDADARRLQDEINRRMAAALARAKAVPGVTLQTSGYNVFQERPDKAPPRWHGSEGLILSGRDAASLLALAGALQEQGLIMSGLGADVSTEAARAAEEALTSEALARLRQRAERIAKDLGSSVERYRDLRVGNAVPPPGIRPMQAMAAARAPIAAPVAEPGEATVALNVEADIELKPVRR